MEVVKAIIHKNDKYLLQLRDNKPNIPSPNTWGLFGGGVDSGETHKNALIRELKEELNWEPNSMIFFYADDKLNTKWFSVYCNKAIHQLKLLEGQAMKWFNIKELKQLKNIPQIVNYIINKHEKFLRSYKYQNDII